MLKLISLRGIFKYIFRTFPIQFIETLSILIAIWKLIHIIVQLIRIWFWRQWLLAFTICQFTNIYLLNYHYFRILYIRMNIKSTHTKEGSSIKLFYPLIKENRLGEVLKRNNIEAIFTWTKFNEVHPLAKDRISGQDQGVYAIRYSTYSEMQNIRCLL